MIEGEQTNRGKKVNIQKLLTCSPIYEVCDPTIGLLLLYVYFVLPHTFYLTETPHIISYRAENLSFSLKVITVRSSRHAFLINKLLDLFQCNNLKPFQVAV